MLNVKMQGVQSMGQSLNVTVNVDNTLETIINFNLDELSNDNHQALLAIFKNHFESMCMIDKLSKLSK
jgi:hypothetical protein